MRMLWLGMAASIALALVTFVALEQLDWSSATMNTSPTSNVRL